MTISTCMNRYGTPLYRAVPEPERPGWNFRPNALTAYDELAGSRGNIFDSVVSSPAGQVVAGVSPAQLFILRVLAGENRPSLYISTRGQAERLKATFQTIWKALCPHFDFADTNPRTHTERFSEFVDVGHWSTIDLFFFVRERQAALGKRHGSLGYLVLDCELDIAADTQLGLWNTPDSHRSWLIELSCARPYEPMPLFLVYPAETLVPAPDEPYMLPPNWYRECLPDQLVQVAIPANSTSGPDFTEIDITVQRSEYGRPGAIHALWDHQAQALRTPSDCDCCYTEGCPEEPEEEMVQKMLD